MAEAATEIGSRAPAPAGERLEGGAELYPALLKLRDRRALVVGGGPVGLQKALELLRCGALVHVVAICWTAMHV